MRNPIKIIDKYVVKSFIPPFVLWTMIALFVLLLQMMWVYIDEIMGKGAGLFFITEMIFYLSVFLVPQALLIGVLTASVMVMGSLAENYELSSMKSAGVSLLRVMRPMLVFCIGVAAFSYVCADYLSPLAKLKYNARLYDIRRQKPALAIEEGVFSDNFPGYTIRIAKKSNDGRHINDVMIYQTSRQTAGGSSTLSEVIAKDGEMYSSEDEQFMIMKLNEGRRYEKAGSDDSHRFAFIRTKFKEWNKVFEVTELERTDERLFGNNQATKTVARLYRDIDSIGNILYNRKSDFAKIFYSNFSAYKVEAKDTTKKSPYEIKINQSQQPQPQLPIQSNKKYRITGVDSSSASQMVQDLSQPLSKIGSIIATFPRYQQVVMLTRAKGIAENLLSQAGSNTKNFDAIRNSQAKHICELHTKFLMSVMCLMFVFVGAPMGAIVRKGGFGYPILVAISLFILYIFSYIMFRKLGEQGTLDAAFAMWMPCAFMGLIGGYLTWHATRDSRVFKTERFQKIINLWKKVRGKKIVSSTT
jgi:lipopolysaccharide export system permease protein